MPAATPREPRVIAEELFKSVLRNERRRAHRTGQPFVMVLVTVAEQPASASSFIWKPVIDTLATLIRETDVMGWVAWRSAVGVVLTEVRDLEPEAAREVEARLSRELVARLDAEIAGKCSVRLHVHPQPHRTADERLLPDPPQRTAYDAFKRGLDLVGSLSLLLVLSPLFILICGLVKAGSRGPIFFGQKRVGQMMKPFKMLKFRTMHVNADESLHRDYVASFINASARQPEAGQPAMFKITNDPRVTPVGRVLRKTSLDELPQLWNVVRGEMSLVGPRPPVPYEFDQYKPWHCRRLLEAKPGMTGLWQVVGRSRTSFDDMVRLDLQYARTCSLRTDLKILLATPRAVISGKGAC